MKQKYAICYVSNISKNTSEEEVEKILSDSQEKNKEKNITGVLLYSEGNFFQILEGEETEIVNLFELIKTDKRHQQIFKIFDKKVSNYKYDGYIADFVSTKTRLREPVQTYMQHITTADVQTRNVIQNMLKLFISSN